jgi:sulfhydrogenase subunit beta (sulfur reductase)
MPKQQDDTAVRMPAIGACVVMEREQLSDLFGALRARGYTVIGPTVRDGAIVYDEITAPGDLPAGYTDEQEAATYRLRRRDDAALFGYAVGPHSWKQYLHPPFVRLWQAERTGDGFQVKTEPERERTKYAFVGVRACELHAIAIQDRVFLGGAHVDPIYQRRREDLCVIAVNCTQAGGTCFCVSMQTGPRVTSGFDLALTESCTPERHYFVAEVGSALGAELLAEVPHEKAGDAELLSVERAMAATAAQMGRSLETSGLRDLLVANPEHPRWQEVANRCLTCGNCTQVCPTCFCTTVEDVTDLTGMSAERLRRWDSCFTTDFSYIVGGSVRHSAKARYRQWLTHKLATWIDQFGTSGCVGCGRCITWCPVGIDLTEEARAIRETTTTGAAVEEA